MKRETLDFISGNRNCIKDEFILGREKSGRNELIFITLPELDRPLYALWNSPKTKMRYVQKKRESTDPESDEIKIEKTVPKGTGGKPSYVMFMVGEFENIKLSVEARGVITGLFGSLEWNTGRVCRKRDKKSLTVSMMAKLLGISNYKVKKALKELIAVGVMNYDKNKKAYFISRKFVKKGMALK